MSDRFGWNGGKLNPAASFNRISEIFLLSQPQPADSHAAHGSFHDLLADALRHGVVIRLLFQPFHVHRDGFNGQRLILYRLRKLGTDNRLRSLYRADGVQCLQQIFK